MVKGFELKLEPLLQYEPAHTNKMNNIIVFSRSFDLPTNYMRTNYVCIMIKEMYTCILHEQIEACACGL